MRRREFITLVGGAAAAWPLAAGAQQRERLRRIAVLNSTANDVEGQARIAAFRQRLKELGWIEHRNVQIDERWTAGETDQTQAHASELVSLRPDVILGTGGRVWTELQRETRTIPIVTVGVPIGLIGSLARPGGNATGFSIFESSLIGKLLAALKEAAPHVTHASLLIHPDVPNAAEYLHSFEESAPLLAVRPIVARVRDREGIERALNELALEANGGVLVPPNTHVLAHRDLVLALAARHRLPSVSPYRTLVAAGSLMSYGPDFLDVYRRAADYVDRILKGEKPADLPVQTPTKFELVINLKTAKALGIEVPPMLLARADEVIE